MPPFPGSDLKLAAANPPVIGVAGKLPTPSFALGVGALLPVLVPS
jgi:hypothetical protein